MTAKVWKTFEELDIWKDSRRLTFEVYSLMRGNLDRAFAGQIQRASLSIMNNIAEGFERRGNKEFSHFLNIAKGSAGEVRSMLYAGLDLQYFEPVAFERLNEQTDKLSRQIATLIKRLS